MADLNFTLVVSFFAKWNKYESFSFLMTIEFKQVSYHDAFVAFALRRRLGETQCGWHYLIVES